MSNFVEPQHKFSENPPHILIVEDSTAKQLLLSNYLKMMNATGEIAKTGEEAIQHISSKSHFDMILMDLKMPGMDGYETSRHIRNIGNDYCKNIPIIAISSGAVQDLKISGITDFISNFYDFENFYIKMREYLVKTANSVNSKETIEVTSIADTITNISPGNNQFIKDFSAACIDNYNEFLDDLTDGLKHNNKELISNASHKIKALNAVFKLNNFQHDIDAISVDDLEENKKESLLSKIKYQTTNILAQLNSIKK